MTNDTLRLKTIATFPDPLLASQLSELLGEHGIPSELTGDAAAGILTENLNDIQVVVQANHAERAAIIAQDFVSRNSDRSVDWSQIDVGDSSEVSQEEANYFANPREMAHWYQFQLSTLFKLECAVAIIAAFIVGLIHAGTYSFLFAIAAVSMIPLVAVYGITRVAGHKQAVHETIFLILTLWLPAFLVILMATRWQPYF